MLQLLAGGCARVRGDLQQMGSRRGSLGLWGGSARSD